MEQQQSASRFYSVEEYLALEEQSEMRHEYYRGEVFAMAGGTANHNELVLNLVMLLRAGAQPRGCRVFAESVQLAVSQGLYYTYPDVMVTCHPGDIAAERQMHHPLLLAEVLSPSTAERDRIWKMLRYQRLDSLRHYLLISQEYQAVEWYQRASAEALWTHRVLIHDEFLELLELALRIRVGDIYGSLNIQLSTTDKPLPGEGFEKE
ncbi:Uma2 family endonuclease [Hymenobacter aerilatus]|uniref:Uma2 family endonuclease n=1 Tax=Hymenobacter aerilatus TaxID=2932251 RepID=A0A8T9SVC0_9BACT|nr:Uma2 family endonuclease [Hymenobacter aerilatus]UOR04180.1 Uma2 family endonuclease [Hymenobacter aerilatus]